MSKIKPYIGRELTYNGTFYPNSEDAPVEFGPGTDEDGLFFLGHGCVLGNGVTIKENACISHGVTIGDNCYIGYNAVIGPNTCLGNNVVVGDGAEVGSGCWFEDKASVPQNGFVPRNHMVVHGDTCRTKELRIIGNPYPSGL